MKQHKPGKSGPLTKQALDYHKKQFEIPYRSTVAFCDWLEKLGCINKKAPKAVIDIGSGMGANLFYMESRFPLTTFTGVEKNPFLVKQGTAQLKKKRSSRSMLVQGDVFALPSAYRGKYEGLTSYQTISLFPNFETPLKKMIALKPKWIALTSIFFDGRVDARTIIRDYTLPQNGKPYYENLHNIYSIPLVRDFLATHGYGEFVYTPFEIDIDLAKPPDGMGIYTETLANGRRLQISGPVLMNWYFIMAKRKEHE